MDQAGYRPTAPATDSARKWMVKVSPATQVWKRRGRGTLAEVTAGETVQVNLTVCTLKGPGRVTDVWINADSRELATARELEVHRTQQDMPRRATPARPSRR